MMGSKFLEHPVRSTFLLRGQVDIRTNPRKLGLVKAALDIFFLFFSFYIIYPCHLYFCISSYRVCISVFGSSACILFFAYHVNQCEWPLQFNEAQFHSVRVSNDTVVQDCVVKGRCPLPFLHRYIPPFILSLHIITLMT